MLIFGLYIAENQLIISVYVYNIFLCAFASLKYKLFADSTINIFALRHLFIAFSPQYYGYKPSAILDDKSGDILF